MAEQPEQPQPIEVPPYNYDNEWVKFLTDLAKNESMADLVAFINGSKWNDRQKNKIMSYTRIVLGKRLGTTFIQNMHGYYTIMDMKALTDCDLPLGLLRVDITPEFNLLCSLINLQFQLEISNSMGGFFVKRAGLQKHEVEVVENKKLSGVAGIKQRLFGGD